MPPKIKSESEINIATYGDTNMGQLKHVYRKGLAIRYGKTMQCVSGIHYNFSLSDESLKNLLGTSMQEDKDKAYLGLIRNFKRLFWFIPWTDRCKEIRCRCIFCPSDTIKRRCCSQSKSRVIFNSPKV